MRVPRHQCKIISRTFSILQDAILPYQQHTTAKILTWLDHKILAGHGAATTARVFSASRTTVRRVCAKYCAVVNVLRLPGHAGAFETGTFLRRLFALGVNVIADLFARWKELEPKLSLVGIHPR